jgi:GT2 family glycosyltransferase
MPDNALPSSVRKAFNLIGLVVLYKLRPSESSGLRSLLTAIDYLEQSSHQVQVVLFDNTPGGQDPGLLPKNVRYFSARSNVGLATAYNRALEVAQSEGYLWLLTLDQDTQLPPDFLVKISLHAAQSQSDESVAAIVPHLKHGATPVSPIYVGLLRHSAVPEGFTGLNDRELYALNSAALLRVSALRQIGGFCEDFWLDQLDLALHRTLHDAGMRTYVAGDIQVQHELSLQDYRSLPVDRLRNFLQAESAFFDLYKGALENQVLTATLLFRYFKRRVRGENHAKTQAIFDSFKQRILHRKHRRIADWKESVRARSIERGVQEASDTGPGTRPRISVCMATYNGEEFVAMQLRSILDQLAPNDEVVAVDDASTDHTCNIIENMNDSRIRLIVHKSNQGVLSTFEEAIQKAKGEILFLSDQDDLWAPDKVLTVLDAFRSNPKANIVVSDAKLIDNSGRTVGSSYYRVQAEFQPGVLANLVHCRYLGCTMAVRAHLRAKIMPFPKRADILHDLWIGSMNSVAGGATFYIDRPLVYYRRHERNATGNRRLSIRRQIRIRWDLCRSLARAWLGLHLRNMR